MVATRTATALLVDDEAESRKANQKRLEDEGYTVLVAQDQKEALIRVRQSAPNVIFVHLGATGLGNLPMIQALRSEDGCRHIPVVIVTNHHDVKPGQSKLRAVHRDGW